MSHRHHSTAANQVNRLINDVRRLNKDEAESLYGIEIHEDGSIYDTTYQNEFISLFDWATFTVEQDGDLLDEDDKYSRFDDEE